jgi:hypothetical protein
MLPLANPDGENDDQLQHYVRTNPVSASLTHIDAALEIHPGVAEAWSNYGLVLSALNRLSDNRVFSVLSC